MLLKLFLILMCNSNYFYPLDARPVPSTFLENNGMLFYYIFIFASFLDLSF